MARRRGKQPDSSGADVSLDGQRVRSILAAHGRTQREVAEALGIGSPHMSMLLSGQRKPSMGVLLALAGHLGVPVDVLTGRAPFLEPVAATLAAAVGGRVEQVQAMTLSERARRVVYAMLAACPDPRSAASHVSASLDISPATLQAIVFGGDEQLGDPLVQQLARIAGIPLAYFYAGDMSWAREPARSTRG